jgi:hypothetical protein
MKCWFTGVTLKPADAYVLNSSHAKRAVRELREQIVRLERLTQQLDEWDVVKLPAASGAKTTRRDRRLVGRSVAQALGAVCPDRELFVPWQAWRARGRAIPVILLTPRPEYAQRIEALSLAEKDRAARLSWSLLGAIPKKTQLSEPVRAALIGGVCVRRFNLAAPEIIAELRERWTHGRSLADLGVPPDLERQFWRELSQGLSWENAEPLQ